MGYLNELLTKKRLRQIIATTFRTVGNLKTVEFLDKLKDLGFGYAMRGGLSVALSDIIVPKEKDEIISKARKQVDDVQDKYLNGFITSGEKYNKVIDIWTRATNRTADKLFDALAARPRWIQSTVYDGRFRRARFERTGASACRYARTDGETAEIAFGADGRTHREPDHLEFP